MVSSSNSVSLICLKIGYPIPSLPHVPHSMAWHTQLRTTLHSENPLATLDSFWPRKESSNRAFEYESYFAYLQPIFRISIIYVVIVGIPMVFPWYSKLVSSFSWRFGSLQVHMALQNRQPAAGDNFDGERRRTRRTQGTQGTQRPWLHISRHCKITCIHMCIMYYIYL